MANKTVYPYGTRGSLPSSIGIINDLLTGGADKALSAEQGKVLNDKLYDYTVIDTSSISTVKYIIGDSGKWATADSGRTGKFLYVIPGNTYRIKANASSTSYVAALQDTDHTSGYVPHFATGCSRVDISQDTYYEVTIPEDGHYLYFSTLFNDVDCSPASISLVENKFDKVALSVVLSNTSKIDTDSMDKQDGWIINSSNKWYYSAGTTYQCVLIPATPGGKYVIDGATTGSIYALLKSDSMSAGTTPDFCTGYSGRAEIYQGEIKVITAPDDAEFIYLLLKSSGAVKDSWVGKVAEMKSDDSYGSDGFNNPPERFCWLKLQQALKMKWTPKLGTIQQPSSTAKYAAGTRQTGIPYSSVAEYDKRIGFDVSFHTFMTAINNPYSVMYTECVRYGYSQSAYGREYYGPTNSGPFYGMVCSNFVSYGLGTVPYVTAQWGSNSQMPKEVVYDQSANGVKMFDVLWRSGHVGIITNVWRENGIPTKIEVSEEWPPVVRTLPIMSASEFNSYLSTYHITIYRYTEMYKNIKYTPSPYVAVGDETPQTVTYNNDICTFYGDKPSFLEGELIYIHCRNLEYPQMELYKGTTLVDTITLASDSRASLTSDELCYAVNLSNDNLSYGKYKARLKNGDSYSDYTYFEIINASVTISGDTATYSSENAAAIAWYWNEYHSTDGQDMIRVTPLNGNASGTIDLTSTRRSGYPLLKVLFRGDYGNVAATFLES